MIENTVEPSPPAPRRRGASRLLFIALPILVIGGGVAYANFKSSTSGADSPQAAVERLVRAVTDEDPLGVIAALDPAEANLFRDAYKPTADQAASQGVVADKGDPLASVDVRADNLQYDVHRLGQGVAAVKVTRGTFSASFDPSKLPAHTRKDLPPEFLRKRSGSTSIAQLQHESSDPLPSLVTVKRGDSWYVSVFYSIAEGIRSSSGVAQPDFDHPPASNGASSPKDVITQLADAVGKVDLDKGLQLLDPESLRVLVDYRSTIEAQVKPSDVADARQHFAFALDNLDVSTTKLDDVHTRVDVKTLRAHATSTEGRSHDNAVLSLDGTCYSAVVTGSDPENDTGCLKDSGYTFGLTSFFIVVAQRSGQYYLDPLRTLEEYARVITDSKDFDSLMCSASGKQCKS